MTKYKPTDVNVHSKHAEKLSKKKKKKKLSKKLKLSKKRKLSKKTMTNKPPKPKKKSQRISWREEGGGRVTMEFTSTSLLVDHDGNDTYHAWCPVIDCDEGVAKWEAHEPNWLTTIPAGHVVEISSEVPEHTLHELKGALEYWSKRWKKWGIPIM